MIAPYVADTAPAAVIVADGDIATLSGIVLAGGGRVADTTTWAGAADLLDRAGSIHLILVDTVGAAECDIADVLPTIDRLARTTGARVVMVLSTDQIDLVSVSLFGPHVDLQCDSAPAILAGAVALALVAGAPMSHDRARDGDVERLRRLSEEVARIAVMLTRLAAPDYSPTRADAVSDSKRGYSPPPDLSAPPVAAADIRRAIRARRLRDQQFPDGLFEDPAWDMLLDLYAAQLEGAQVSVSSLCIAAAVPPTTALRWLGRMTEMGLFERQPDPADRRRIFMVLSATTRERMQRYFALLAQAGLPIT
ncbi:winged helix DNA-binding protein [uncultured Sphingomonas sp.]|uniref:winged helix DNA-binding protein n=1 Tax=uncultured Sphingomonas sp. TaxID=158754 RepID=UPI0035CABAF6